MNIVSLLYNKIQIISLKQSFLAKSQLHKTSVVLPPDEAKDFNLDHWGLYLKKAMEAMPVKSVTGKIKLILGQRFWRYSRIELPPDITDEAQAHYIRDNLSIKTGEQNINSHYKYIVNDYKGKKYACVYLLTQQVLTDVTTLLSFYDLKIEEVYPEALIVFTLFEHNLNKQKEEAAMFLEYEADLSTGLLFNSTGLIREEQIVMESADLAKKLKDFKKDQKLTIARLILGGTLSTQIRQDNFTKESGIWTNPLEKVLQNSSLKQAATKLQLDKDLLQYNREIALINLVQNKQHLSYSLPLKTSKQAMPVSRQETPPRPRASFPIKGILKILLLILTSSVITFGILSLGKQGIATVKNIKLPVIKPKATPTPTPKPKPRVTPTPIITIEREEITIEILNGTGVAGMAASLQSELEDLGYEVASIGNAEDYDYAHSVIITKNKQVFNLLSQDLKSFGVTKPEFEQTNDSTTTLIFGADLKLGK